MKPLLINAGVRRVYVRYLLLAGENAAGINTGAEPLTLNRPSVGFLVSQIWRQTELLVYTFRMTPLERE